MPFVKVDKDWLQPFVNNAKQLLEEYENCVEEMQVIHPINHPKWHILFMKDSFDGENINLSKLPLLKSLIDDIPDNIFLVLSMYSIISPGLVSAFHSEPYPRENGYRRYHVPLRIPAGARFEVQGEGISKWKVGECYEFMNPGTPHRLVFPQGKNDRIVFLIDVFEDHVPDDEELKICYDIGAKFLDKE